MSRKVAAGVHETVAKANAETSRTALQSRRRFSILIPAKSGMAAPTRAASELVERPLCQFGMLT